MDLRCHLSLEFSSWGTFRFHANRPVQVSCLPRPVGSPPVDLPAATPWALGWGPWPPTLSPHAGGSCPLLSPDRSVGRFANLKVSQRSVFLPVSFVFSGAPLFVTSLNSSLQYFLPFCLLVLCLASRYGSLDNFQFVFLSDIRI